jgi:hypothetical protein
MSRLHFCDKCGGEIDRGHPDPQPNVKIEYAQFYFCEPCLMRILKDFEAQRAAAYRLCGLRFAPASPPTAQP